MIDENLLTKVRNSVGSLAEDMVKKLKSEGRDAYVNPVKHTSYDPKTGAEKSVSYGIEVVERNPKSGNNKSGKRVLFGYELCAKSSDKECPVGSGLVTAPSDESILEVFDNYTFDQKSNMYVKK